jgi:hypothetical protein
MIIRASIIQALHQASSRQALRRVVAAFGFCSLGFALSGCADMSDNVSTAFADPGKYGLYDCKQLETERKNLATRSAELQGLMEKAKTGVGGAVVAELAYRNDYVAVRGQAKFADEAWQKNKCHESPPEQPAVSPAAAIRAKLKSKSK